MFRTQSGIYQSQLFDDPSVIHGFSSKRFGDMRNAKNRTIFLTALGLKDESLIWQEQIHKDAIHHVAESDRSTTIAGVDGLVYKQTTITRSLIISVHTADCVPLLALDPVTHIIGVAHAGWRGTVHHIGNKLISEMELLGGNVQDVRVVIGPRISVDGYDIPPDRAKLIRKEFPQTGVVIEKKGVFYADLGSANYEDLKSAGVQPKYIEYDPSLTTNHYPTDFYSFRRNGMSVDGEILGVIGF